jgi:FMN phosphatase YigB (HAD superfamily)
MEGAVQDVVFLLDVDNTLLDHDAVVADLRRHLRDALSADRETRYWDIFEQRRAELGYVDYLGALQRYRRQFPADSHVLEASLFLLRYDFAGRLYPGALDAIARLRERGPVVIVTDGDVVFQPFKIERSGLWSAVDGRVLIYIHKETMLDDIERRFPAPHYVMVDDKIRILAAMKAIWHERLTTVFVRQGHYAREADPALVSRADRIIDRIADLTRLIPGFAPSTEAPDTPAR